MKHGWTTFDSFTQEEYKTLKSIAKLRSCATTNLVKAYQALKGCTEEEARLQVAKDVVWVDTSHEDTSTKEKKSMEKRLSKKKAINQNQSTNQGSQSSVSNQASMYLMNVHRNGKFLLIV
ncbi:unnamed protein product [Calypogeia fissa]